MYKHLFPLLLVFLCGTSLSAEIMYSGSECSIVRTISNGVDLELSIDQPNADPAQFTVYSVVLTATNAGSDPATGVQISIPMPAGIVYEGGNEGTASAGNFQPFPGTWNLGVLAAGQSETLTVNYFLLDPEAPDTYAQVSAQNEPDMDSTPGNGAPPSVNEDDEASTGGGGGDPCDNDTEAPTFQNCPQDITVVANPNTGDAIVNFNFPDFDDNCSPLALNPTTNVIPGSSFPIGTTQAVISVTDLAGNEASCTFDIIVLPPNSTNSCGFVENLGAQYPDGFNRTSTVTENISGYQIVLTATATGNGLINRQIVGTDLAGQLTNSNSSQLPAPANTNTTVTGNDATFNIAYSENGTDVFSTEVTIDPMSGTILDQIDGTVRPANGGYLYVGTTVTEDADGIGFFPYVIRFDPAGNVLGSDFLPDNDVVTGTARILPQSNDDGDYVVTIRSGNADLHLIDGNGQVAWKVDLFQDTPSSTLFELEESPSGDAVYASIRNNQTGTLRKYDAATGGVIYLVDYGSIVEPDGVSAVFETVPEFIPLTDGGAVFAGTFNLFPGGSGQIGYGRVDEQGDIVWGALVDPSIGLTSLRAKIQTSDGGFAFIGDTGGFNMPGDLIFLKVTADGELTPTCGDGDGGGGGSDGVDLELSLEQSDMTPAQFTTYSVTATVTNAGTATATGVQVALPLPDGVVYEGGNEFELSTGNFNPFGGGIWNVGNLQSGESETLTVNYFLLNASTPNAYAQVVTQNETDTDSTPGNGTPPTPNEDDEASIEAGSGGGGGGGGNDLPDLRVDNLTISNSPVSPGAVLNYTFRLRNTGSGDAPGDFVVNAYISEDQTLSADDVQDGTVPTGNYAAGAVVSNISGASTIPAGAAPGTYYLILVVDDNDEIAESNENNNRSAAKVFQVEVGGTDGACGFVQTYTDVPAGTISTIGGSTEVVETMDGFVLTYSDADLDTDMTRTITITTDAAGNQTSFDETFSPTPMTTAYLQASTPSGGSDQFNITVNPAMGSSVMNTITLTPPTGLTLLAIVPNNQGYQIADGGLIGGTLVAETAAGQTQFIPFILKINPDGTLANETYLPAADFTFIRELIPAFDGSGYFLYINQTTVEGIIKVGNDGDPIWTDLVIGDLPSSDILDIEQSQNGEFLYVSYIDNSFGGLIKYDATTGDRVLDTGYGELYDPGNPQTFNQRVQNIVPTDDGGLVFGSTAFNPTANETTYRYARIDAMDNTVWSKTLTLPGVSAFDLSDLNARIQTSDGGFLFGSTIGDQFALVKVTGEGELTPTCTTGGGGGGGTGADLALEIDADSPNAPIYSEYSVTVRLTNEGDAAATNIKVRIPRPAGVVYVGGNEFMTDVGSFNPFGAQTWNLASLAPGASVVLTLNYFILNENPQTVYGQVTVASGNDPDSTPGNGTPPTPNEDDEAALTFNAGGNGFAVQTPAGTAVELSSIAPNPVTQEHTYVTLNSRTDEAVTLELYNAMGQLVKIQDETLRTGRNRLMLDMTGYESGTYFLHLRGENWRNAPVRISLVRY